MKAISLWQPWASAMALGFKQNETRSWPTQYRGDVLICSAKQPLDALALSVARDNAIPLTGMAFGAGLCVVELFGCVETDKVPGFNPPLSNLELNLGDYSPGRFAWLTRNLRRLKAPLQIRGHQGLWILDYETEMSVAALL